MKLLRVIPIGKRKPVYVNPYRVVIIQPTEGGSEISFGDDAPPLLVKDCVSDLTVQFDTL